MTSFDRHLVTRLRTRLGLPLSGHRDFERVFAGKRGLEIGGPSEFFIKRLPIYKVALTVDQINFSATTVWSEAANAGPFARVPALGSGRTVICDGTELRPIADAQYDFVLSCHNLEHIANPLKALAEWTRAIRSDGHLLLIVPNKAGNFDHRRPDTTFEHLLDDQRREMDERDMSHLDEILALHDLGRDPGAGNAASFKARSMLNFENRCLHHHVFSLALACQVVRHCGFEVVHHATTPAEFIVAGCKK
jgi:SAM-dependent methyltransferase